MKRIILIAALSLFALPALAGKEPIKDPKCDNMATFAQGIAQIKRAGYDLNALQAMVSEPKAATFPLQIVKQQIYTAALTPEAAYTKYYSQCVAVGYDALFEYYTHEQERMELQIENTTLKSEIAALNERLSVVTKQVLTLQEAAQRKPVSKPRPQ